MKSSICDGESSYQPPGQSIWAAASFQQPVVLDCPELPPAPRQWCQACQQQLQLTEPRLLLHKQGACSSCTSTGSPSVCCKLAGSRAAATSTKGAVSEHREPSCQRDWNKINVIMLPCFPVQKQKGDRLLRILLPAFILTQLDDFHRGTGEPFSNSIGQFTESRIQNYESWILIQQLSARDINLVICKKVGWNFCCCCFNTSPIGNLQLAQQIGGEVHHLSQRQLPGLFLTKCQLPL